MINPLRQTSLHYKSHSAIPVLWHACGCNVMVSPRKQSVPHVSRQKRSSSYYTFPVFTATQYLLENFHHYSMLPWWGTILGTTLILRTAVTSPLAVAQNRYIAKMEMVSPALKEVTDAVKYNIVMRGKREGKEKVEIQKDVIKELKLHTKDFYKRNGLSRMKLFLLPWVQMPLWITISFALRNISGFTPLNSNVEVGLYPPSAGIETEGVLWFSNLGVPDPYFVLPLILLVSNLLNIEMNALRQQTPSTFSKWLTRVLRGVTVMVFVVSTQVPSAMALYWASSSFYGLTQNIILKFPKVRRTLRIPKTPSEREKPFVHLLDVLKVKTQRFLEIQRAGYKK